MVNKVLFLNRIRTELDLISKKYGDEGIKNTVFLVFDTPENLTLVKDIKIVDANFVEEESSWKFNKLVPAVFNSVLSTATRGFAETLPSKFGKEPIIKEELKVTTFDPKTSLFFQIVEDLLNVISEEKSRNIVRQLIAAWVVAGAKEDESSLRIINRMKKLSVDYSSYISLCMNAKKISYLLNLRSAYNTVVAEKETPVKDISLKYNIRVGDVKWLLKNWPPQSEDTQEVVPVEP